MTRGDNIRQMLQTDEGLADFMREHNIDDGINYCQHGRDCFRLSGAGKEIPDEWCRQCLIEWLREEKNNG